MSADTLYEMPTDIGFIVTQILFYVTLGVVYPHRIRPLVMLCS